MTHGLTGYVKHKCRCDVCKAAKSASAARTYRNNLEANRAKRRAYENVNGDARAERVRRWRAANPGRARAMDRARSKRYADRNRELVRLRYREWAAANRDKARAAARAYNRANPEKAREHAKLRRARLLGADMRLVSQDDWRRLCERYDNRCAYCGADGPLQKDHVIPLTRGGRHAIGNLLPACKPCNSSKNHHLLVEWQGRRGDPATVISLR